MGKYTITTAIRNSMLIIRVNGYNYAYINDIGSLDDIDKEDLFNWVHETCYDDDFMSDQYIPCHLDRCHFLPKE